MMEEVGENEKQFSSQYFSLTRCRPCTQQRNLINGFTFFCQFWFYAFTHTMNHNLAASSDSLKCVLIKIISSGESSDAPCTHTLTKDILLIYLLCFPLSIKCHVKYCLILPPLTLRIKTKARRRRKKKKMAKTFS